MNTYYDLDWDPDFPDRWWLGEVGSDTEPIDSRIFTIGSPQSTVGPYRVPIKEGGEVLPLTFAAFHVPVVTRELAAIFAAYAPEAIQHVPITVGDIVGKFEILNITRTVDAVDRERAGYILWRPEDRRPEKVGAFRQIHHMVFRQDIRPPPHIFRIHGWEVAVTVSRDLKEALGGQKLRGVRFRPIQQ